MSIPEGTIGYGAVVLAHLDEFQGFYVVRNDHLDKEAVKLQMAAMVMQPMNARGALEAAVTEGIVTKNETLTGAAALALWGVTKEPYFYIKATREGDGTRTEMFPLEARSIHAAQIEVNNLPAVLEIKERLRAKMTKRKQ